MGWLLDIKVDMQKQCMGDSRGKRRKNREVIVIDYILYICVYVHTIYYIIYILNSILYYNVYVIHYNVYCICILYNMYIYYIHGTTWDHIGCDYRERGKISEEHWDTPIMKIQEKGEPAKDISSMSFTKREIRVDCSKKQERKIHQKEENDHLCQPLLRWKLAVRFGGMGVLLVTQPGSFLGRWKPA